MPKITSASALGAVFVLRSLCGSLAGAIGNDVPQQPATMRRRVAAPAVRRADRATIARSGVAQVQREVFAQAACAIVVARPAFKH